MGIAYNGNNRNGLIFGGVNYSKQDPQINEYINASVITKTTPSAVAEQTSGYLITFSFLTTPFVLYKANDIRTPLTSLPTYKIFLNYVTQQEVTSLTLVYNGDGTFSWQGELNLGEVYTSAKLSGEVTLSLVDENGECFVSDSSGVLSASSATSTTAVSYTRSTITEEIKKSDYFWAAETPTFPYTIKTTITDEALSKFSTFATPETFGNQVTIKKYQTIT